MVNKGGVDNPGKLLYRADVLQGALLVGGLEEYDQLALLAMAWDLGLGDGLDPVFHAVQDLGTTVYDQARDVRALEWAGGTAQKITPAYAHTYTPGEPRSNWLIQTANP